MKKAIVLLCSFDGCYEFAYFKDLLSFEIIDIVLPIKSSFTNCDIGGIYETKLIGQTIIDSIDYSKDFHSLILPHILNDTNIDMILPHIELAIKNKKEIVTNATNMDIIKSSLPFASSISLFNDTASVKSTDNQNKLYNHETPIIMVAGIHEKTNKFIMQLELRKYFSNKGYKVSQIGTKDYSTLFGFHSFPSLMFEDYHEAKKIFAFNKLVREIEKNEEPDLLIIGVPGGIMPYNKDFPGYFGITIFEVMQAVRPDALVLGCLFDEYIPVYFENIITGFKAKYGIEIDCFNISDFKVDLDISEEAGNLQYNKVSSKSIDRVISGLDNDIPICNVLNQADGEKMAEHILSTLESYNEAEFV